MPLFHVHTFLCLSLLLAFFFIFGSADTRRDTLLTVTIAVAPATFFVWLISDHFHAGSVLKWHPGWVQQQGSDFAMPFHLFWLVNFGAWVPAVLALLGFAGWKFWQQWQRGERVVPPKVVLLIAATTMFLIAYLVKTAPWEWDNMKIIIWAYLLVLPFLWTDVLKPWPLPIRVAACLLLFTSGFVSLIGGLGAGRTGFGIADRAEFDSVGVEVRRLPVVARFAAFPTYNHPVLMHGRKLVMGYPGHLWTQGFDYSQVEPKLRSVMLGEPNWRQVAQNLDARYLFWGREEKANYAASKRPWERELKPVATGPWGSIYDLQPAGSTR
jgi:hypothetical protein